jgi:hypothetical protein
MFVVLPNYEKIKKKSIFNCMYSKGYTEETCSNKKLAQKVLFRSPDRQLPNVIGIRWVISEMNHAGLRSE